MNRLKQNPLLGSALVLFAALLAVEVWLWSRGREQSRRALAALEQKKSERDGLARQTPALSEGNELAIARDLANTRQVVAALRTALQGKADKALVTASPAKSIDLYFDLAAFVEKTRALAARTQVMARPDERFGFATHANEGPEPDLVPTVYRQRVEGQYLVEALLESRPRALLAVQREQPRLAQQSGQLEPSPNRSSDALSGRGAVPADFFVFDRQLSVRVPGRVGSDAFRLEFTGQTPALRAFLNTLATFRLPAVVRRVEVEPLDADVTSTVPRAPGDSVSRPLVAQKFCRFVVIVEVLAISAASGAPAS